MKSGIILMFILLATASPTGQSVSQSSHALDGNTWPLNRLPLRSGELATREVVPFLGVKGIILKKCSTA